MLVTKRSNCSQMMRRRGKLWLSVYTEPETLPARRARCTKLSLFPEGAPNSSNRLLRQLTEPLFSSPWEAGAPLVARTFSTARKKLEIYFMFPENFSGTSAGNFRTYLRRKRS